MKKLLLALSVSAVASQASAVTYQLGYAGLDVPFEPPFSDPGHIELTGYSITPFSPAGPTSSFSITLQNIGGPNPGQFDYSADWTYYGASGAVVINNVSCTNIPANMFDTSDFCGGTTHGGITTNGGFIFVDALDTATQTPLAGPTSDAFDLRWTATTGSGVYDWKLTFAPTAVPVPAAAWLFGSALVGLAGIKRKK